MIVYGKQIFLYILENHKHLIKEVLLAKQVDTKLFHQIRLLNVPILNVDTKKAQALAHGGNHQGFFLDIEPLRLANFNTLKEYNFVMVLVGLTDMGNIGSIIRTAYSLGVDAIVITGVEDIKQPQLIRTSSGAFIDSVVVHHKDTSDVLNRLKSFGYKTYATTQTGAVLNTINREGKIAILMGSEGEGIPNKIVKNSDYEIKIPMKREFDSLNVSNAAAIFINKVING